MKFESSSAISKGLGNALQTISEVGSLPFIRGKWYFVDPYTGADTSDGLTVDTAVKNLRAAYNLCTDGAGDGICLMSRFDGTTSHTTTYLSYPLVWAKNGITCYGFAAPTAFFSRARISNVEHTTGSITTLAFVQGADTTYDYITDSASGFVTAGFVAGDVIRINTTGNGADATGLVITAVTAGKLTLATIGTLVTETAANAGASVVNSYCAPLISITGSDNRFINLHFTNGSTDAAALGAVRVAGNRNYFKSCHFLGAGSTVPAAVATCYDLAVVASELLFEDCVFGSNSTEWGAANARINLGESTTQIGQVFFKDCKIITKSATAGHGAVKIVNAATLGGWVQFDGGTWVNWESGALTANTAAIIGTDTDNMGILLHNVGFVGWAIAVDTSWDNVYSTMPIAAAHGGRGILNE